MLLINSNVISLENKIFDLYKLNTYFNDIIDGCAGKYVLKILNDLRFLVLRLRAVGLRKNKVWPATWQEHSQLIELLENNDATSAKELIKCHIESSAQNVIDEITEFSDKD